MDARPDFLTQWAVLGSVYMQLMFDMPAPRVAIVNVGAEEDKGNKLVKETFPLLKEMDNINFTGSIESRNIPSGDADVIVCEAFAGNIILKLYHFFSLFQSGFFVKVRARSSGSRFFSYLS